MLSKIFLKGAFLQKLKYYITKYKIISINYVSSDIY